MHNIKIIFNKNLHILKIQKYLVYIRYMSKYIIKPFNIFYHQNDLNYPRLGCIIKKTHINFSTKRNLIKRILIKNFIHNISYMTNYDIIITTNQRLEFKKNTYKKNINALFFFIKNLL